eukprot:3300818-Rhodomonas_salina.1
MPPSSSTTRVVVAAAAETGLPAPRELKKYPDHGTPNNPAGRAASARKGRVGLSDSESLPGVGIPMHSNCLAQARHRISYGNICPDIYQIGPDYDSSWSFSRTPVPGILVAVKEFLPGYVPVDSEIPKASRGTMVVRVGPSKFLSPRVPSLARSLPTRVPQVPAGTGIRVHDVYPSTAVILPFLIKPECWGFWNSYLPGYRYRVTNDRTPGGNPTGHPGWKIPFPFYHGFRYHLPALAAGAGALFEYLCIPGYYYYPGYPDGNSFPGHPGTGYPGTRGRAFVGTHQTLRLRFSLFGYPGTHVYPSMRGGLVSWKLNLC